MKLISLLSMIIGSACYGQIPTSDDTAKLFIYKGERYIIGDTSAFTKEDTIPVIMLYCNTEPQEYVSHYWPLEMDFGIILKDTSYTILETDYSTRWMEGYSIHKNYSWYVSYLGKDKKPLPKNIIVWMAKETEK